ncbi:LysR family transcriptional regulator [Oceanimonas sp. NS1]|nr:LysR family transcriptional regulator [Oceanimonas sp. NS1]
MWKLNPRALRYLNEVSRQGSLRKAAARLNVDVSAISRQLHQLEEEIGLPVGYRNGQGFVPTEVGEELISSIVSKRRAKTPPCPASRHCRICAAVRLPWPWAKALSPI